MTIPPATGLASPGWYADPPGSTTMRWWDGTRWTEQTHDTAVQPSATQPYSLGQPLPTVPAGTPVYNFHIWAIVLLPLLTLPLMFLIDIETVMLGSATNPFAQFTDPGYILYGIAGWLTYGVSVLLAFLDWRKLKSDGFVSPFHWAFAFIPQVLVYIIGRSIVARRRSGRGMAPIWVEIGVIVVSIIAYVAWMVNMFAMLFAAMPGVYY